ncbi:hypothetical protein [Streptomyces nanshensis]|uniref:hypothetical protein n=1 Tax=Streptomyces nanshensis TaxID=518642 RepID=UPI0030B80C75
MNEVNGMTGRRDVCAPSADDLQSDVPYVRGWMEGRRGADALAEALRALGLETDVPGLRADVNVRGDGIVCLGEVRPAAAELLTRALMAGLSIEMARNVARPPSSFPPDAPAG